MFDINTWKVIRNRVLCGAQAAVRTVGRPMRLLTRRYGFAFNFPGCDMYGD